MDSTNLLIFLVIGALAGWIAGQLMKGGGFGLLRNMILGIIGGVVGGWLFDFLDITTGGGFSGSLITSVVGAIVVLFIAGWFKK